MSDLTQYVVGFALDDAGRVALIRKNRPAWQAGLYNGIGGHVEPGESPDDAMVREFHEETGVLVDDWETFAHMTFPAATIDFYRARISVPAMAMLRSTTDEFVEVVHVAEVPLLPIIPNLSWLLPLAAYTFDRYEPISVTASVATIIGGTS